ncbi:MAG: nitroreductase family protein [Actinobacteria bacterium]|nr:nitroreductase family protein [Actinomycetota bacterium]
MEFSDVVRRRRMVRSFTSEPVAPEALDRILAAARRAPSAGGTSALSLVVVDDTPRFWAAAWPTRADPPSVPVVVVPFTDEAAYRARYSATDKAGSLERWPVHYWEVDASFAAMLLLLGAVDEGLGAWFFGFDVARVRQEFGVAETCAAVGAVALGHPR